MTVPEVQLIPVDQVTVINPRVRNKKIFREIVENIAEIRLKRPVTVARRGDPDAPRYDLVCGQGRLEAFQALGEHEIPAIVIDAKGGDCLMMSLVENLARRQHRGLDLLHGIESLKTRGYRDAERAEKTGLTIEYTKGVLKLLKGGEHRLLRAVEAAQIPVSVAVSIAESDDKEVQAVLLEAYEKKLLRGNKLALAKKLVARRQQQGKGRKTFVGQKRPLSVHRLLRTYQDDTEKKRAMVHKAEATHGRLIFVIEALRKLFADEDFLTLLRAEGFETLPSNLNARLDQAASA